MTNKLEAIQRACIAANPEIVIEEREHYSGEQEPAIEAVIRTIRLADILLAIGEKIGLGGDVIAVDSDGTFHQENDVGDFSCKNVNWNLRQDDLTKQSPECIDFLSELLT